MSPSALLPPSRRVAGNLWAVSWSFAIDTSLLGGESPPHSPVRIERTSPGHRVAIISGGILPPSRLIDNPWSEPIFGQSGAGGNRTPPRVCGSYLVKGNRPWPVSIFECPEVTASDLEWPGFDAFFRPVRPFSALGGTAGQTRTGGQDTVFPGRDVFNGDDTGVHRQGSKLDPTARTPVYRGQSLPRAAGAVIGGNSACSR